MNCTINYKGKEYTEEELISVLATDPDMIKKYQGQIFGKYKKNDDNSQGNTSLSVVLNETFNSVLNLHSFLTPKTKAAKRAEYEAQEKGKTSLQKVEELKAAMEKYNELSQLRSLYSFVNFAESSLKLQVNHVDKLSREDKLTPEMIKDIRFRTGVFNMLPEIKGLLIKEYDKADLNDKQKEAKKKNLRRLDKIVSDLDTLHKQLLAKQKDIYAKLMAENSTEHFNNWRTRFEDQYDIIQPEGISKDEWVNQKIADNSDDIKDEAIQEYLRRAEKSFSDISSFAGMALSEKNIDSREIQVASKMIDFHDLVVDDYTRTKADEIENHFNDFSKRNPDFNVEKRYSKFIDNSAEGTYLHSRYKASFLDARNEALSWLDRDVYDSKFAGSTVNLKEGTYALPDGTVKNILTPISELKIEGDHIIHTPNTSVSFSRSIEEFIGIQEKASWDYDNTKSVKQSNGKWKTYPSDKWLNEEYDKLSSEDIADLEKFKSYINEAETLYKGNKPLKSFSHSESFYRLPGITKTTMSRLASGNLKSAFKDKVSDLFKIKEDEFEIAESNTGLSVKKLADLSNKQMFEIPIPFRKKLKEEDQSLDLHTILLLNLKQAKNFEQKKQLEAKMHTLVDVMGNRLVPNYQGLQKLKVLHGFSKDKDIQLHYPKDKLPNDVKKLLDMMENRIYGLKEKDAGKVGNVNFQKATNTLLKWAGSTALIGNFLNSIVNATTGTVNNLIEAWSGETYNLNDWKIAGKKYWKDSKDIINDIGSNTVKSKTNLMMNLFNVMGSREALHNNFEDNVKMKSLAKSSSLRPIAAGGEHMMQSKVMYAVLNSIKITNTKGEFLNKDGNVVSSKKEAASFDEVLYFEKGHAKLPNWVESTTFSPGKNNAGDLLLDTRNLIKKKIIDLHGNYDNDLKAAAQREWWGKLLYFLKKWMIPTALRRFRGMQHVNKSSEELRAVDKFYSEDLKNYQEGYYTTAARFMVHTLPKAIKELKFEIISADYKNMNKHEKANMRRLVAEMSMIALVSLAYVAIGGMDDEPDEDTLVARYLLRRELAELTFYLNPAETIKLMKNPSASVSVIERATKVIGQAMPWNITEEYEQGKNKGRLKLWVKSMKIIPGVAQTEKDLKASLRFLQVME